MSTAWRVRILILATSTAIAVLILGWTSGPAVGGVPA